MALLHASEEFDYRGLSVPLVNIRYTLTQAHKDGVINSTLEKALLEHVKALPYPERTFECLLHCKCLSNLKPTEFATLETYLHARNADIKKQDAIGVLQHVNALAVAGRLKSGAASSRQATSTRQQLDRILMTTFYGQKGSFDGRELLKRAQADGAGIVGVRRQLSTRRFMLEWATQNGVSCPHETLMRARETFAAERSIANLPAWLQANGLTFLAFTSLLDEYAFSDWLESEALRFFNPNESDVAGTDETNGGAAPFILDWARKNGVAAPNELSEPTERVFVDWIIAKEPPYFGMDWRFELEFLRFLQITGRAGQLLFSE